MSVEIEGSIYFLAADVVRQLGVARTTLWRWRKARKIPQGRLFRDRHLVFTSSELTSIRQYANRLVPAEAGASVSNVDATARQLEQAAHTSQIEGAST